MQPIFIKAVTAPDDSRDIMHYETYYYGENKIFSSLKDAEKYLMKKLDKEIKKQVKRLETDYFYSAMREIHNNALLICVRNKAYIKRQIDKIKEDLRRKPL